MTKPVARDAIYRRRRFRTEDIEQCVRWYITYRLSYRDLAVGSHVCGSPPHPWGTRRPRIFLNGAVRWPAMHSPEHSGTPRA
jgi:hypothetical protein